MKKTRSDLRNEWINETQRKLRGPFRATGVASVDQELKRGPEDLKVGDPVINVTTFQVSKITGLKGSVATVKGQGKISIYDLRLR